MIVAKAARDGRAPRKIFCDKGTYDIALKALLMIHHVVRNSDVLRHAASVVNIVERTTAARYLLGHALVPSQPPLIPELHGETDNVLAFGTQHRRNGRRIHPARHGCRDSLGVWHILIRAI